MNERPRSIVGNVVPAIATFLLAVAVLAPAARAGEPTEQLRRTIDEVLHILSDPARRTRSGATADRDALRRVIEARFDFAEMARRALGVYWHDRSPAEQRQFIGLFRALLERAYADRIEAYHGEAVRYLGESVDGDHALVRTVIDARNRSVPVGYRLLRRGGRWLIYDVLIEGVSLVENYRSQFRDIIATSSYAALVHRIEARLEALRAGAGPSTSSG